ncbi:hypothetical protein PTSG_12530 [Salpingoeca rosetta]|uniref:Uncharacterized protein n=1 Tax=Salpingoeca rosetta (strain ATCC 50818 / BSB-021) TaxID=946362 RepID=F2UDW6_SALR5|nr:uncharacterized protein PTSG_12530 [Salpingoeca rosetta]EGD74816.1 hypothetical protein PTSG_12530 [Salpingoeca rosetta]|eukprot:XP_004992461.1 hypothetical protein PTSG_12530 [Salpingoeca rosetta]
MARRCVGHASAHSLDDDNVLAVPEPPSSDDVTETAPAADAERDKNNDKDKGKDKGKDKDNSGSSTSNSGSKATKKGKSKGKGASTDASASDAPREPQPQPAQSSSSVSAASASSSSPSSYWSSRLGEISFNEAKACVHLCRAAALTDLRKHSEAAHEISEASGLLRDTSATALIAAAAAAASSSSSSSAPSPPPHQAPTAAAAALPASSIACARSMTPAATAIRVAAFLQHLGLLYAVGDFEALQKAVMRGTVA